MMSAEGFTVWLKGVGSAALARPLADAFELRGRKVELDNASGVGDVVVLATDDSSQGGAGEHLRRAPRPLVKVELSGGDGDASDGGGGASSAGEDVAASRPDAVIRADAHATDESVARILSELEALGLLAAPAQAGGGYDDEDEEIIRQRLEAMGYL
jgi:hypothetical protein